MRVLGIDLSSSEKGTSTCIIDFQGDAGRCHSPRERCPDTVLDSLIEDADAVGVDAPLGWPVKFKEAVSDWRHKAWDSAIRDELRYRETDRVVRNEIGRWPLSVSSDLIALPAMRAMALLERHGVEDKRGGDQGFYEVYPAASLRIWDLYERGYKKSMEARRRILSALQAKFPNIRVQDEYASTGDNLDSLVAAITVKEAFGGGTLAPSASQLESATNEGWIHLPTSQDLNKDA